MRRLPLLSIVAALAAPASATADEGMWTFDAFPSERVKAAYGHGPDAAWLERVRKSSVRLAQGCSGSFVSKQGLVLTNHHCVFRCVQQLSSKTRNLVEAGFSAATAQAEERCPNLEVNQLTDITDVTKTVKDALNGKTGEAFTDAKKAAIAKLESACAKSDKTRCDVVSLYRGGRYHLYTYRRYEDVRLVFAPEVGIAFFGGDPDNFNFPRFNLDFGFLRVYDGGQPAVTPDFLPWNAAGPEDGDLVYVSGHPASTDRQMTVAQLAYQRDYRLPEALMTLSELRGRLAQFGLQGKEQARIAKGMRFGAENAYKAYKGRREALVDEAFFAAKAQAEAELQRRVAADSKLAARVGDAWGEIARAQLVERDMRYELRYVEPPRAYFSKLVGIARTLVRWGAEKGKPSEARLPEFAEAKQPALRARLFSRAPIYPELEIDVLTYVFEKMQRELGPDHEFVKVALDGQSPRALAKELVRGTKLADVAVRQKLFGSTPNTIARYKDPMLAFARRIDGFGRALRKRHEAEVESVVTRAAERIAAARFAVYGTDVYPDASFSLRLSYGTVRGFPHRGREVPPFTTYAGLYRRATGEAPFDLPPAIVRAKARLNPKQRLNFVSTNDIIGGNSGSPLIDRKGRLVGLVFDGNIYSLGGAFGFDPRVNRTVAVHAGGISHALDKVYRAKRLVTELSP